MPRRNELGTPLRGNAINQFRQLRWGNSPKRIASLNVPALTVAQPLMKLGILEQLILETSQGQYVLKPARPLPWLLVGAKDNRLYIAGGSTEAMARAGAWGPPGARYRIARTDYSASKAGEYVYWYHDHEQPFPWLEITRAGFPAFRGGRYTVREEGIVG